MLSQMKKPVLPGFGRRNDLVTTIGVAKTFKQQDEHEAKQRRKQRPQPLPMAPGQRALNYIGSPATPAQRRRAEKKAHRWARGGPWHNLGLDVSTATDELEDRLDLPEWDASQCSCHINPPCGYCEGGEYRL